MEQNTQPTGASKESLWYLDNYILLKDYYDRTISRIAARCIRMGNIAMEEYKYYGYILDVLEEISETGDYILEHKELYPYVEKKIAGGMESFKKTLAEYQLELKNNSSPDMIKEDAHEVEKMKEVLGEIDKTVDPTVGAGMNMDQLMEKLMAQNNMAATETMQQSTQPAPPPVPAASTAMASNPQMQQARPQPQAAVPHEVKKIIKIKKPVSPDAQQAIPAKDEVK